jgi:hypothetical protein
MITSAVTPPRKYPSVKTIKCDKLFSPYERYGASVPAAWVARTLLDRTSSFIVFTNAAATRNDLGS